MPYMFCKTNLNSVGKSRTGRSLQILNNGTNGDFEKKQPITSSFPFTRNSEARSSIVMTDF